jgi:phenylacetate-coenzyme A ligase PaaK-like adenylate-forming protein
MSLAARARASLTVLRLLPAQRRIPYQQPEVTAEQRDARVREIVRYAVETVPYYRDLFAREDLDPQEIRSAEQLRQLPTIDKSNYNAVEAFKIGHFCELRRGYHLFEDLCDLWLAGPDGAPSPSGERGEVVISNLVNRATVLLNYRLGDFARLSPDSCDCGRTAWGLSGILGGAAVAVTRHDTIGSPGRKHVPVVPLRS